MADKKVNKAHWTQVTHIFSSDEFVCSNCGFKANKAYNECPKCHSEMNGKKYNPNWVDEMILFDIINDDF